MSGMKRATGPDNAVPTKIYAMAVLGAVVGLVLVLLAISPTGEAVSAAARLHSDSGEAAEVYWEEEGQFGVFRLARESASGSSAVLELSMDGNSLWESGTAIHLSVNGDAAVLGTLTVNGDVVFDGNMDVAGNVAVGGSVDGVDVSEFKAKFDQLEAIAVTKDGNQTIDGVTTFASGLDVTGDLAVTGTVDGVDVEQLKVDFDELQGVAVTTISDQSIAGSKTFTAGLDVDGNLTITGLVDGVDVDQLKADFDELEAMALTKDGNQTVDGVKTFASTSIMEAGLSVSGDISVTGTVDGVDLPALEADFALLNASVTAGNSGGDINVAGDVHVAGDLHTDGLINGVDLLKVQADVSRLNSTDEPVVTIEDDQTISGSKTFVSTLTATAGLNVSGDVKLSGSTINGTGATTTGLWQSNFMSLELSDADTLDTDEIQITANVILFSNDGTGNYYYVTMPPASTFVGVLWMATMGGGGSVILKDAQNNNIGGILDPGSVVMCVSDGGEEWRCFGEGVGFG